MYSKSFAHLYKHTQDLETASFSCFPSISQILWARALYFWTVDGKWIFHKKKRSQRHPPIDFLARIKNYPEVIVPGAMWEKVGVIQWHQASHAAVKSILACFSAGCYREIKCMAWISGSFPAKIWSFLFRHRNCILGSCWALLQFRSLPRHLIRYYFLLI